MPKREARSSAYLSPSELDHLARLLFLSPDPDDRYHNRTSIPIQDWLRDQEHRVLDLPNTLLKTPATPPRGGSWLKNLLSRCRSSNRSPSGKAYDEEAKLCAVHRHLNATVIGYLASLVAEESMTHVQKLLDHEALLPIEIRAFLRRMISINRLWMRTAQRKVYQMAEGRCLGGWPNKTSFANTGWELAIGAVPSGCEACVLAIVGGDGEILCDFMASIIGRRKSRKHRKDSIRVEAKRRTKRDGGEESAKASHDVRTKDLLALIGSWASQTGPEEDMIHAGSKDLGKKIRKVRRELQNMRRKEQYGGRQQQRKSLEDRLTGDNTTSVRPGDERKHFSRHQPESKEAPETAKEYLISSQEGSERCSRQTIFRVYGDVHMSILTQGNEQRNNEQRRQFILRRRTAPMETNMHLPAQSYLEFDPQAVVVEEEDFYSMHMGSKRSLDVRQDRSHPYYASPLPRPSGYDTSGSVLEEADLNISPTLKRPIAQWSLGSESQIPTPFEGRLDLNSESSYGDNLQNSSASSLIDNTTNEGEQTSEYWAYAYRSLFRGRDNNNTPAPENIRKRNTR